MLTEWFKAMMIFVRKGYQTITMDVNGKKFSEKSILGYYMFFFTLSLLCVIFLPKGFDETFVDYIKDIFSIFIGFFVTALSVIYDKLNITKIPSQEEKDNMPADKRPSSKDIVRIKQEHNYVIRFFYSIGLNILFASLTLLLLIPFLFWNSFFSMDLSEYSLVVPSALSRGAIFVGGHVAFIFIYRLLVIFLIVKVFFFTVYMITSLLQVLILKKKI